MEDIESCSIISSKFENLLIFWNFLLVVIFTSGVSFKLNNSELILSKNVSSLLNLIIKVLSQDGFSFE